MADQVANSFWQQALSSVNQAVTEQQKVAAKLVLDVITDKIARQNFVYVKKEDSFCVTVDLMSASLHPGKKYPSFENALTLGKFIEQGIKSTTGTKIEIEQGRHHDIDGGSDVYCTLNFYFNPSK